MAARPTETNIPLQLKQRRGGLEGVVAELHASRTAGMALAGTGAGFFPEKLIAEDLKRVAAGQARIEFFYPDIRVDVLHPVSR